MFRAIRPSATFSVKSLRSRNLLVTSHLMPLFGFIVVIRRPGGDGSIFPVGSPECLLGRSESCNIRIQLPTVSREHCKISINANGQAQFTCLSRNPGQTHLNAKPISFNSTLVLRHGDILTIADRSLRWEYPKDSPHNHV